MEHVEKIVDYMFINCAETIPQKLRKEISLKKINRELFKEFNFGENILSKEHNKYAFRLLQIFGFRDESVLSFIDKDHMKSRYYKAIKKNKFKEDLFLEQFQATYFLQTLSQFRNDRMMFMKDFRQTPMKTSNLVDWNS